MPISRPRTLMLAAAATSGLLFTAACGADDGEPAPSGSPTSTPDAGPEVTGDGAYEAGDYSAEGSYLTPGGEQSVVVDLTLAPDGTISAVTVEPQADGGNSKQFQEKFAGGIDDVVVGRKIDELDVTKVSGSSLTSGGFNAAIDEIKDEAAV